MPLRSRPRIQLRTLHARYAGAASSGLQALRFAALALLSVSVASRAPSRGRSPPCSLSPPCSPLVLFRGASMPREIFAQKLVYPKLFVHPAFTLCRPRMPRPELPHPCSGSCGSIRRRTLQAVTAGQLFCLFRGTGNPTSRRTEFVSLTGSRIFSPPGESKISDENPPHKY